MFEPKLIINPYHFKNSIYLVHIYACLHDFQVINGAYYDYITLELRLIA